MILHGDRGDDLGEGSQDNRNPRIGSALVTAMPAAPIAAETSKSLSRLPWLWLPMCTPTGTPTVAPTIAP